MKSISLLLYSILFILLSGQNINIVQAQGFELQAKMGTMIEYNRFSHEEFSNIVFKVSDPDPGIYFGVILRIPVNKNYFTASYSFMVPPTHNVSTSTENRLESIYVLSTYKNVFKIGYSFNLLPSETHNFFFTFGTGMDITRNRQLFFNRTYDIQLISFERKKPFNLIIHSGIEYIFFGGNNNIFGISFSANGGVLYSDVLHFRSFVKPKQPIDADLSYKGDLIELSLIYGFYFHSRHK